MGRVIDSLAPWHGQVMKLRAPLPAGLLCLFAAACVGEADDGKAAGSAPCEDSILFPGQADIVPPDTPEAETGTDGTSGESGGTGGVEPELLGCDDALTTSVPGPPVAWTIELERGDTSQAGALLVGEDVLVVSADSKLWGLELDDGSRRWGPIPTTMNLGPANLDLLADGRLVIGDRFGSSSNEYLVYDAATGEQQDQEPLGDVLFNWPMVLGDGDRFWLGSYGISNDTFEVYLGLRRYDPSSAEYDREILVWDAQVDNDTFGSLALDGGGRIALLGQQLYILDLEDGVVGSGLPLASAWGVQVVSYDEGWATIGWSDQGPAITRVDGEGAQLWSRTLSTWLDYTGMAIAARPGGGLVVAGAEQLGPGLDAQPAVLLLDGEGEPEYGERIAAVGQARAAAVGPDGAVHVSGEALVDHFTGGTQTLRWVRRYEP